MKKILLIGLLLLFTACSNMKVSQLDPTTNRFKTEDKAIIVKSIKLDLDKYKSLLLLPNDDFMKGQIQNIKYFDKSITIEELESEIIKNNLIDKVPSITDKIGVSRAAREYKPFLWLRFDVRDAGEYNKRYAQFILTNPKTSEDLLIVEKHLDYIWAGVNDQNTWYPLFNAIVDYIDENSKTWAK